MLRNSENFYEFKDFVTIKKNFEFFYLNALESPISYYLLVPIYQRQNKNFILHKLFMHGFAVTAL